MRSRPVALVAGNVEANRVVDVILDGVLLPGADRSPVPGEFQIGREISGLVDLVRLPRCAISCSFCFT